MVEKCMNAIKTWIRGTYTILKQEITVEKCINARKTWIRENYNILKTRDYGRKVFECKNNLD